MRTFVDVVARGVGHHFRRGPRDLNDDGIDFARVIAAAQRFFCCPQAAVGRDHFAHRHTGAQAFAQLSERPIGHTRHRRDDHFILERDVADLHRKGGVALLKEKALIL